MSPLLTARPSVSVTLRLLGATVVMALIAASIPFFGGDGRSSAVVPACLTVGILRYGCGWEQGQTNIHREPAFSWAGH